MRHLHFANTSDGSAYGMNSRFRKTTTIPLLPATICWKQCSIPTPNGVMAPIPVMTTRCIGVLGFVRKGRKKGRGSALRGQGGWKSKLE